MPTIDSPIGLCCIAFQRFKDALTIRCATCGFRVECAANYQRESGPAHILTRSLAAKATSKNVPFRPLLQILKPC